jgi:hypothetical protein
MDLNNLKFMDLRDILRIFYRTLNPQEFLLVFYY